MERKEEAEGRKGTEGEGKGDPKRPPPFRARLRWKRVLSKMDTFLPKMYILLRSWNRKRCGTRNAERNGTEWKGKLRNLFH